MLYAILTTPACEPPAEEEPAEANDDSDADADTDPDVDPDALHGTVPEEALPAPEFSARNRDGPERGRADLVGHPTVTWYYPVAGTSG